jgi:peroxiredoxin
MTRKILLALLLTGAAADHARAQAQAPATTQAPAPAAAVGKTAPAFELTDTDGKTVKLESYRGKVVVLEWFNPGCPFVKYGHGEGPLKDMAARWTKKGVVWLAINSGAAGKQGHGRDANAMAKKEWKMTHAVLLDETGAVGRAYGAKTTPHMFVIDRKGVLVYAGGLDNAPLGRVEGAKKESFVDQVLSAVLGGKKPPVSESKPYGCGVKYGS